MKICTSLLALSLAAGTAAAQTPPCLSLNDATTNTTGAISAFSFAGVNAVAWQFQPAQASLLFATELFTGNTSLSAQGYMSLEIWDSNFIFQPGQRLGGGTFQIESGLGVDWHGCNLDQPVQVNAGQTYWLVWREPGFSELPYEPGGVTATTARLQGSTWVTQATSQAPKWRAYCQPLDQSNVQPNGFGCSASTGGLPTAFTNHEPTLGNGNFAIEACGFPTGAIGVAALGLDPAWVSVPVPGAPGCQLHTDALVTLLTSTGTGDERAIQPPNGPGFAGHTRLSLPIGADPALIGTFVSAQFVMLDPGATSQLPFVFSSGLQLTVQ
ncbi:MAG: hypothetical protein AB8H80_16840 [Planctomycetota bacterium]